MSGYLFLRGDRYFFRMHVPLDLRVYFGGRKELRRSLKASRYNDAKALTRTELFRTEQLFTRMRSGILTNAEIKKLVNAYFTRTLEDALADAEDARADGPVDGEGLSLHLSELQEALVEGEHVRVAASVADSILACAGLPALDKGGHEYRVLCREALKGAIAATQRELMALRAGQGMLGVEGRREVEGRAVAAKAVVVEGTRLLSSVVREYIEDRVRGKRWRGDRTRVEVEGVFALFVRIVGDRDIRALERRDFSSFRDALQRWPANVNKRREFRGMTVEQVLARAAPPLLSTTSVNKYLMYVSVLMDWAVQNQYVRANLAKGLTVKKERVKENAKREDYNAEDLKRLFASPIYTDPPTKQPERYWLPLILLLSGMRLNEAAGLRAVDVREEGGVLCFDVNEEGDRPLKNANSQRIIPVHPILIDLGFREYTAKMRGQLFPNLEKRGESYGVAVSRWWGRYGREHVSSDRRKSLHSFRHTFITALNRAHVPEAIVAELAGHAHGNIDRSRYGHGFEVKQLKEAVEKVTFEGLPHLPNLSD